MTESRAFTSVFAQGPKLALLHRIYLGLGL
jgi:hypothetical protein